MTRFIYENIKIDSVSDNSVVSYGENLQSGFLKTSKSNEGFGSLRGDRHLVVNTIQWISDNDQVDAWRNRTWVQKDEKETTRSTCSRT